jgi:hypothetical protein
LIELGSTIVVRDSPLRLEPAAVLETVERGVQSPFIEDERLTRRVEDPSRDVVAVTSAEYEGLEDEYVECAAEEI